MLPPSSRECCHPCTRCDAGLGNFDSIGVISAVFAFAHGLSLKVNFVGGVHQAVEEGIDKDRGADTCAIVGRAIVW